MPDRLLRHAFLFALFLGLLSSTSVHAQQQPSAGAVTSSPFPQGPRLELLVQKPVQLDGWRAQRRARFLTAIGSGVALGSAATFAANSIMDNGRCRYAHSVGPTTARIGIGIGLGMALGGSFWLGHSRRRYGKQGPGREQLRGVVGLAFVTAAASAGVLWGLYAMDSIGGCP